MEVLVRNADGNLPVREREYAAKKLVRLDRFFSSAQRVEIVHREVKHRHWVEITVFADGITFRGEEADESVHAAIDKVVDKMENRLRRVKTRLVQAQRRSKIRFPKAWDEVEPELDDEEPFIREHKHFLLKPMSLEEASLQMELVDKPFFVFLNEATKQTEVLYRHPRGGYGLVSPQA